MYIHMYVCMYVAARTRLLARVAVALIVTLPQPQPLSLPTRPPVANQRTTTQLQIKGNAHRSRSSFVARMLLGRFVMRLPAVCYFFPLLHVLVVIECQ